MEHKMKYIAPAILEELKIEMEGGILASSSVVKPDTEVISTGQEIEIIEADEFNHTWEDTNLI